LSKFTIIKEIRSYPKTKLATRVYELEKELANLNRDHNKAIKYLKLALHRINPDRRKLSLINEFYPLYGRYLKNNTHEKATQAILKDPIWLMLCKLDPMLARMTTPKSMMNKYNAPKKVKSQKK
jgi:hypothetical protein